MTSRKRNYDLFQAINLTALKTVCNEIAQAGGDEDMLKYLQAMTGDLLEAFRKVNDRVKDE